MHNQMRGVHGYHGADFALKNMNQSKNLLDESEFDRFNSHGRMDTSPILKRNAQRFGNQDIAMRDNAKYEPLEMAPVAFIPPLNNQIAALYPYI